MPENVTIINNGGDVSLGVITNLVCSGYAKFGGDSGSLFAPGGDLQISGSLITYTNVFGRGGLYAGNPQGTNYSHGAFLRGGAPSGDDLFDSIGLDYALLGSGLMAGDVVMQPGQYPNATARVAMPLVATSVWANSTASNSAEVNGSDRVMSSGELSQSVFPRGVSNPLFVSHVADSDPNTKELYSYSDDGAVESIPVRALSESHGITAQWFGQYRNQDTIPHSYGMMIYLAEQALISGTLSDIAPLGTRAFHGSLTLLRGPDEGGLPRYNVLFQNAVDRPGTDNGVGVGSSSTLSGAVSVAITNLNAPAYTVSGFTLRFVGSHGGTTASNVNTLLHAFVLREIPSVNRT